MIELFTLGSLRVRSGGQELIRPRKAIILLVLLADSSRVTKTSASSMLWPDAPLSRALHSLHQTLYSLRRFVGRSSIKNTDSMIQVVAPLAWDYKEALRLIGAGDLRAAFAIVNGPFLNGIEVPDGDSFDEWRQQRQAFLAARLLKAVEAEAIAAEANLQWDRLLWLADETIRLFPNSGQSRLVRVKALVGLGFTEEAKQSYEQLHAALRAGVVDHPLDTVPTMDSLTESVVRRAMQVAPGATSPVAFVGRIKELNALEHALAQAESGIGRTIVVSGTAGIGKTTLCKVFAARAKQRGVTLITGNAYPTERHLGYNVVAEALQHAINSSDVETLPPILRDALQEILPDIEPHNYMGRTPQLGYEAAQRRLFEAITRLVQGLSARQTVVLFIDDVHWADDATLAWLNYFARRTTKNRIMLLITMRLGERPRLLAIDMSIMGTSEGSELELRELSEADTATLVRTVRPEWDDHELIDTLTRTTGGHPLLVSEALKESSPDNALKPARREIKYFTNQLRLLEPVHHTLLEWLAVAGTPLPVRILSTITAFTPARFGQDFDALSGFCTVLPGNTLAFKHDLIRESIYQAIQHDKRIALHAELGNVLERDGAPSSIIAHHFHEAGLQSRALRYALEAAAQSELIHAYSEAEYFYRLALAATNAKESKIALSSRLADMLFRSGSYARAIPLLAQLSEHHANDNWAFLHWEWKHLKSILAAGTTDPHALFDRARSLETRAQGDEHPDALFAAVDIQSSVAHQTFPIWTEELPRLREALLSLGQRFPLTPVGTNALARVGHEVALTKNAAEGLTYVRRAMHWANELKDGELEIQVARSLAMVLYNAGNVMEARQVLDNALKVIDAIGGVFYTTWILSAYAAVLIELDDASAAESCLRQLENTDPQSDLRPYLSGLSNRAQFEFYRENYVPAISSANTFIHKNAIKSWMETSVRGIRGLAKLELGGVAEAFADAAHVEPYLRDSTSWVGDLSHPFQLLVRTSVLRHSEGDLVQLLEQAVSSYEQRDYVCCKRLELALAEALIRKNPSRSASLCKTVMEESVARGLVAVENSANRLLRTIDRRSSSRSR